jgi:hypothetical protein
MTSDFLLLNIITGSMIYVIWMENKMSLYPVSFQLERSESHTDVIIPLVASDLPLIWMVTRPMKIQKIYWKHYGSSFTFRWVERSDTYVRNQIHMTAESTCGKNTYQYMTHVYNTSLQKYLHAIMVT